MHITISVKRLKVKNKQIIISFFDQTKYYQNLSMSFETIESHFSFVLDN